MATQGKDSIRKARSVHWAPDIKETSPKPRRKRRVPTQRHNRRSAPLNKRPITVIHGFGLIPPITAARPGPPGRIEVLERQTEPIQIRRFNRAFAMIVAGTLLFSTVAVACIILRFYRKF